MQTTTCDLSFKRFLDWFGNVRDIVEINIEKIQDSHALGTDEDYFPFTEEEIDIWQRCGLISVSEVYLKDFVPHQKITKNYSMHRMIIF